MTSLHCPRSNEDTDIHSHTGHRHTLTHRPQTYTHTPVTDVHSHTGHRHTLTHRPQTYTHTPDTDIHSHTLTHRPQTHRPQTYTHTPATDIHSHTGHRHTLTHRPQTYTHTPATDIHSHTGHRYTLTHRPQTNGSCRVAQTSTSKRAQRDALCNSKAMYSLTKFILLSPKCARYDVTILSGRMFGQNSHLNRLVMHWLLRSCTQGATLAMDLDDARFTN